MEVLVMEALLHEIKHKVNLLLEKYPELMDHFEEYLAHCETFECFWTEEILDMPIKVKDRDKAMWRQRNVKKRYREKRRDKEKENNDKYSQPPSEDAASKCSPSSSCKEKYNICKPVLEAGPMPSYHYVERNNLMPPASDKTKLGASVLNDVVVCRGAMSESTSKKTSINSYEASFFNVKMTGFILFLILADSSTAVLRSWESRSKSVKAQEAASRSASAAIRVQQAATPASSLKQRPPLGRTTVSKEEEGRQARAAERQMRMAAAERRITALNPLMATTPAVTPPQLAAVPSSSGSGATDVLCTCCNVSLAGKVPFHRYNYRYCSTSCMYIRKQMMEDE